MSKMPSPSSSSTRTLIHALFLSQVRRAARALTRAKSFLVKIFRKGSSSPGHLFIYFTRNKKTNKIYFGSFRLHYNWCSSRYRPVPNSVLQGGIPAPATATGHESPCSHSSSTWQYVDNRGDYYHDEPPELSGYLQWLEDQKVHGEVSTAGNSEQPRKNEIDRLADMFIARCHEKFILEKQESDRRFNEMLARSM